MKRDWDDAVQKVYAEGKCRVCGGRDIETAHCIGRARDERRGDVAYVHPDSVVPLCRAHHREFDAHELDLLPYLTPVEQARAVLDAGGLETARRRIIGRAVA